MKNQKHDDKTTRAYAVLAQLETRYRVRICEHAQRDGLSQKS